MLKKEIRKKLLPSIELARPRKVKITSENQKLHTPGIERAHGRVKHSVKRSVLDESQETLAHSSRGGGRWFPPSSPAVSGGAPPRKFAESYKIGTVGKLF